MTRYDFKTCLACGKRLPKVDFYKAAFNIDGYSRSCKECSRTYQRGNDLQGRTRMKVIEVMGGKCKKCGFSDWRALQIDHINGGGSKHRASVGWYQRYREAIEDGGKNYQLLCANCNQIKKHENKEFTHGHQTKA